MVYGGEKHMVGATILSSESALRVGTGSVKIICDKKNIVIYSSKFPSLLKAVSYTHLTLPTILLV